MRKSVVATILLAVCLVAAPTAAAATIYGGPGNNTLWGPSPPADTNDIIYGAGGNDQIRGWNGDDWLFGESGNDTVIGDDGDDVISGGAGSDTLIGGGTRPDHIYGGTGNDEVHARTGYKDYIDCGGGNDRVEYFDLFNGPVTDELHNCERYGPYPGKPLYPN